MCVSIVLAATTILVWDVGEETEGGGVNIAGYIVVVFVCLFVFNFAVSWG